MTIYAIVNNLIGSQPHPTPCWTMISQSAILQGGNPYFVPDFAQRFEAHTAIAVRIGKLGKGIASRFVSRYVDAVAPAVLFIAADRLRQLRTDGLPWASAISYDRCLAIGKFTNMPYEDIMRTLGSLSLKALDSGETDEYVFGQVGSNLAQTVESLSRDNTIKTGDILLLGVSEFGPKLTPGLRATLRLNGEEVLSFNIR